MVGMREYYQLTAEEAKLQVNGSLEPLTAQQAAANREKYGPNELADGKKKSMLRIFLEPVSYTHLRAHET